MSGVKQTLKDFCSSVVNVLGVRVEPDPLGARRVERLAREYKERGFLHVLVNKNFNAGVDIIAFGVFEERPLIEVVESCNWMLSEDSGFMKDDRFERYVNSLNAFDVLRRFFIVKKKLVISYWENLRRTKLSDESEKDEVIHARLKTCKENGIEVVAVGYQD